MDALDPGHNVGRERLRILGELARGEADRKPPA